jgi:hypothetical protein
MDPKENLAEQLRLAHRLAEEPEDHEACERLADLVMTFGGWARESGFLPAPTEPPHPMQPLVVDDHGVVRFKANRIVRFLTDTARLDLNQLRAVPGFRPEDWEQFNQLIGYSVSGYGDLSTSGANTVARADALAEQLLAERPRDGA